MRNTAYGIGLVLLCSCSGLIYENDSYSLFPDKVVQGEYVSIAESPDRIVSNLNGESYIWASQERISSLK